MLQLFAYDTNGVRHEVNLYSEDPVKLTISSENIDDIAQTDSSYSRTFRVPANQQNSRIFSWWYEINTIDYDVTKKIAAEIYVDGIIYKTGYLRMQGAYDNRESDNIDLEIVFFGETSDFSTQVGQGYLNSLDLSDSNHLYSYENMELSWNAFDGTPYEPGDPSGTLNGQKVRYILAQRGYDYDDSGILLNDAEISISFNDSFDTPGHPLSIYQMTPMIQVKHIIDAIFAETDYSYTADSVFNQDWFRYLYTDGLPTALAEIPEINSDVEWFKALPQNFGQNNEARITNYDTRVEGELNIFNPLSGVYKSQVPDSSTLVTVSFDTTYSGSTVVFTPIAVTFRLYVNGVVQDTFNNSGTGALAGTASLSYAYNMAPGDEIWVTCEWNTTFPLITGYIIAATFQVADTPTQIITATLLRDDIKKVDFLKSIMTKFKLLMVPARDVERTFVIKPWVDYVGTGEEWDWTHKMDESKDAVISPVFFEQTNTIDFKDAQDIDYINAFYQDSYARVYGELFFDAQNELINGTRDITTIFAPTPLDQIYGDGTSSFIIPWFARFGDKTTGTGAQEHLQILPIDAQPRLLFWNGMQPTGGITWYDQVDSHDTYPLMSPYSVWPPTANCLNLNWFKEFGFFEPATYNGVPDDIHSDLGYSVYEAYWNTYIQSLYSPLARKMTAYFTLDAEDLRYLTFDDAIFIKNSWWRPLKIYDAPLTDTSTVKVDLIKMLNYPPLEESPVGGNWGIASEEFPGGGDPGDPVLTTRYYQVLNCTVEEPPIVVSHTSYSVLPDLTVVNLSGSGYVEQCYTIVLQTSGPAVTTILDTFDTCESCLAG